MARSLSDFQGSRATARFIWISPSKARQVTSLIVGKPVDEARRILAFSPRAAAREVSKVLESAVANAEHNHQIPQDELFVRSAWADDGPIFKRMRERARRAAYLIRKRTCHLVVVVERIPESYAELEPAAPRATAPKEKPGRGEEGAPPGEQAPGEPDDEADEAGEEKGS